MLRSTLDPVVELQTKQIMDIYFTKNKKCGMENTVPTINLDKLEHACKNGTIF